MQTSTFIYMLTLSYIKKSFEMRGTLKDRVEASAYFQ